MNTRSSHSTSPINNFLHESCRRGMSRVCLFSFRKYGPRTQAGSVPCCSLIVKGGPPFYYFQVGPNVILCNSAQTSLHKLHFLGWLLLAPYLLLCKEDEYLPTSLPYFSSCSRLKCALTMWTVSLHQVYSPMSERLVKRMVFNRFYIFIDTDFREFTCRHI